MVRRRIASQISVVGGLVCSNVSGLFVEQSPPTRAAGDDLSIFSSQSAFSSRVRVEILAHIWHTRGSRKAVNTGVFMQVRLIAS